MGKIKICCLCEYWSSGGIESFVNNVVSNLDLSDLEIDIVAARIEESIFTEGLKTRGVNFYELSGSTLHVLKNHRLFKKLLAKKQYDVLHLNAFNGLSLAYLQIAAKAGVKVRIGHSHCAGLRKSPTRWIKMCIHSFMKFCCTDYATDLWACSSSAANFLFSRRGLKKSGFVFIPNGIDVERFRFSETQRAKTRSNLGISDKFAVGHVGRLCGEKNQLFLLDMLKELVAYREDSVLLLVGEGNDIDKLKARALQLELADRVIFYGVTKAPEELYSAMDVFVFPSLVEGLGMCAIEAQACGLSVLCSSNVPPETILTETSLRKPLSEGASAWAQTVNLLCNGDRNNGADEVKARKFSAEDTARLVDEYYRGNVCGRT